MKKRLLSCLIVLLFGAIVMVAPFAFKTQAARAEDTPIYPQAGTNYRRARLFSVSTDASIFNWAYDIYDNFRFYYTNFGSSNDVPVKMSIDLHFENGFGYKPSGEPNSGRHFVLDIDYDYTMSGHATPTTITLTDKQNLGTYMFRVYVNATSASIDSAVDIVAFPDIDLYLVQTVVSATVKKYMLPNETSTLYYNVDIQEIYELLSIYMHFVSDYVPPTVSGSFQDGVNSMLPKVTELQGQVSSLTSQVADLNEQLDNEWWSGYYEGVRYAAEVKEEEIYQDGYNAGYSQASSEQLTTGWFFQLLGGFGSILDMPLLGSIKLWHLVAFPLVLGCVFLLFKFIK